MSAVIATFAESICNAVEIAFAATNLQAFSDSNLSAQLISYIITFLTTNYYTLVNTFKYSYYISIDTANNSAV